MTEDWRYKKDMCELFGINSAEKINCNNLLWEFFRHSEGHPHGWGLATFYDNAVSLEKEPISALESAYLKNRLTEDIVADKLIAHIRRASVGKLEYKNSHPFVMRDADNRAWTLAHNGTIFACDKLESYFEKQKGSTDSERILCYLMDLLNVARDKAKRELMEEERFSIVDEVVHTTTSGNKVNFLLYDGSLFYVHTNHKDSLYRCQMGKTLILSTEPLSEGNWESMPTNTLFAYRDGELLYTGKRHENDYADRISSEDMLFNYRNI